MFELGNVLKTDFSACFMQALNGVTSKPKDSTSCDYDIADSIIQRLLSSEIANRHQNAKNATEAISMVQTFQATVADINGILEQMVQLADEASSGSYTEQQREAMQQELEQLGSDLNDIVETAEYNNNKLLTTDGETISISIGNGSTIDIAPGNLTFDAETLDLTTDEGAVEALSIIQAAIEEVDYYGEYLDTHVERLGSIDDLIEFAIEDTMSDSTLERILTMQTALDAINKVVEQESVLLAIQANVTGDTALELLTTTE